MHEFLQTALPWILLGLAVAVAMVWLNRKK